MLFCKLYIVYYRIRQEKKTKFTFLFLGKTMLKLNFFPKTLPDLVILEFIPLKDW